MEGFMPDVCEGASSLTDPPPLTDLLVGAGPRCSLGSPVKAYRGRVQVERLESLSRSQKTESQKKWGLLILNAWLILAFGTRFTSR